MISERGPDTKRHVPSYRSGCFYRRIEDCCWACYFRMIWETSDPEFRDATRGAERYSIIGTELDVPVINRITGDESVEYRRGEVTNVIDMADDDSAIVAIELETGEEVTVGVQSMQ